MSTRAFTPGPWTTQVLGATLRVQVGSGCIDDDDICVLGDCRLPVHQANAALIADAPAMYELLAEIVHTLQLPRGKLRDKCTVLVDKHDEDLQR